MTEELTLADMVNSHYKQVDLKNTNDQVKFAIYQCKEHLDEEVYVTRYERGMHFREKHPEFYKVIKESYDRNVKGK